MENEKIKAQQWRGKHSCIRKWEKLVHGAHTHIHENVSKGYDQANTY